MGDGDNEKLDKKGIYSSRRKLLQSEAKKSNNKDVANIVMTTKKIVRTGSVST